MQKNCSTALMVLLGVSLILTVSSHLKRAQIATPIYSRPDAIASYSTNSGAADVTAALMWLVLSLAAIALLVFLVQTIQRQLPKRYPSQRFSREPQKRSWLGTQTQSAGSRFGSAIPVRANGSGKARQLQSRLLVLLNGDRRTAERLLERVQAANPDRSTEWCLDKVIYDLKRDRRG